MIVLRYPNCNSKKGNQAAKNVEHCQEYASPAPSLTAIHCTAPVQAEDVLQRTMLKEPDYRPNCFFSLDEDDAMSAAEEEVCMKERCGVVSHHFLFCLFLVSQYLFHCPGGRSSVTVMTDGWVLFFCHGRVC